MMHGTTNIKLWGSCVVKQRSLRRADHSSRRDLPTVVRRCGWSKNRVGPQRNKKKLQYQVILYLDRKGTYKRKIEAHSCNHCLKWKAISITYSEGVFVALGNQHAERMHHISMYDLSSCTVFFPHYLINGTIFGKMAIEHKMCALIFSTTFARNTSNSKKKNWARYGQKKYTGLQSKLPVIFVTFWRNLNFPDIFSKNIQILNFMKICPAGAKLFHADGQTDRQTDTQRS